MFGSIGGAEILLILVVALLLFGPRRLPQIGRTIGKALGEFRRATTDFKSSLEREVEVEEIKQTRSDLNSLGRDIGDLGGSLSEPQPRRERPETAGAAPPPATQDEPPVSRPDPEAKPDAADD